MIVVFDKGGLEGWLAEEDELAGQTDAVALLSDGRQVRIPVSLLQPRNASAYDLPLHFSELAPENAAGPEDSVLLPVHEETLEVGKRRVEKRLEIRKTVSERQATVERPVTRDEVEIERVRVDRPVDGPVPVRREGETLVIPLLEEEVVTQKRLVLREELRITKRRTRENRTATVALRSEDAVVTRTDPGDSTKKDR